MKKSIISQPKIWQNIKIIGSMHIRKKIHSKMKNYYCEIIEIVHESLSFFESMLVLIRNRYRYKTMRKYYSSQNRYKKIFIYLFIYLFKKAKNIIKKL
jgi:hypothetical protein